MYQTILRGADLSGANLAGACMRDTDLREANLSETNLKGVNFTGADLEGARLIFAFYDEDTVWPDKFSYSHCGAIGPQANLRHLSLRGLELKGADLSYIDMRGADLTDVKLGELIMRPDRASRSWGDEEDEERFTAERELFENLFYRLLITNLRGAILQDVKVRGLYNRDTQWSKGFDYKKSGAIEPEAYLPGTDLKLVTYLAGADLSGIDLSNADLSSASLYRTDFAGANLRWRIYWVPKWMGLI